MFRGPNPGDGTRLSDYSHVIPLFGSAEPGPAMLDHQLDIRGSGAPSGRAWSGGGGRWLLWPLRVVLWAILLIIAYRGVTAIVFHQASAPQAGRAGPGDSTAGSFPVTLAEAYATEFGQVYLNFSPATQGQREQELAAFVPPGGTCRLAIESKATVPPSPVSGTPRSSKTLSAALSPLA